VQFCIIAPATGLQKWATKSKAHLVLSHVTNALYQQFYRKRSEAGDLVILDNGAYEGQVNSDQLLERIGLYHPKVVVLPDLLGGSGEDSFRLSKTFHDRWRSIISHTEWMYVPQGETLKDFEYALNKGIEEIQPEWIALPRILGTKLSPGIHTRAQWCAYIHDRYPSGNVHGLGMLSGDTREIPYLADANCSSIDSSAPVWRGWNGFDIHDERWDMAGVDVNFDAPPLSNINFERTIAANLRQCGVHQ
jgi:hypothetical protein